MLIVCQNKNIMIFQIAISIMILAKFFSIFNQQSIMTTNIYFWNQIMDITGRTAIVLIIAFIISHLIIKNNFNIIQPKPFEKVLLTLTYFLIYIATLLFNYGEKRLLIFDLALPIIIVSGILSGLRVSLVVSGLAAIMLNVLFPLSWPYAILTILAGIISGLLSHLQQNHREKMIIAAGLQFILSCLQVSIIYFLLEGFLYQTFWEDLASVLIVILIQVASVLIFLYIIYSIIDYQKGEQTLYLQNQARLKNLESQINPHFLFNSLNTIGSLTRTQPEKAHTLIIELSSLLRSSLRRQGELVPLVDELKNIDSYLTIATARFGSRLVVQKNIPDIYNRYRVPNLIWQPIVENAISHNIKQQETVKVSLSVKKDNNRLYLITQDNGQGISQETINQIHQSQHLGLAGTIKRLHYFYQKDNLLEINSSKQGTIVTIKIPL